MPIELYTGDQGSGKTYSLVKEAMLPALRDDRFAVLSNLDVRDWKTGRRSVNIVSGREVDFDYLMTLIDRNLAMSEEHRKTLLVAVDEIGLAMPQEMWRSDRAMDVVALTLQLRKGRVDFVGTVQHFERAVKVLRDNCNLVHECRVAYRDPRWWRRDTYGVVNRRTGRFYKLPWLFEVESLTPAGVHLASDSKGRKRARRGFRKVRFERRVATSYDTYQRIGPVQLQLVPGLVGEDDAEELVRVALLKQEAAAGELVPNGFRRGGRFRGR